MPKLASFVYKNANELNRLQFLHYIAAYYISS
jgi:hypothetical protein